jgi:hypothetical protein
MRYALIDEDGILHENATTDYTLALGHVGPEGWGTVHLGGGLAGFVNDCGLVLPDAYRRNPVGGLTLIMLGAQKIPYAGPIVITGWDPRATYRDESEVIGLTPLQTLLVRTIHGIVSTPDNADMGGDEYEQICDVKNMISGGAVPPVTFGSVTW